MYTVFQLQYLFNNTFLSWIKHITIKFWIASLTISFQIKLSHFDVFVIILWEVYMLGRRKGCWHGIDINAVLHLDLNFNWSENTILRTIIILLPWYNWYVHKKSDLWQYVNWNGEWRCLFLFKFLWKNDSEHACTNE